MEDNQGQGIVINRSFFRRSISIGQVLVISIGLLGTILTFYTETQVKLKELDLRVTMQEKKVDNIEKKIDVIIESTNDIKVLLQSKEDKQPYKYR